MRAAEMAKYETRGRSSSETLRMRKVLDFRNMEVAERYHTFISRQSDNGAATNDRGIFRVIHTIFMAGCGHNREWLERCARQKRNDLL